MSKKIKNKPKVQKEKRKIWKTILSILLVIAIFIISICLIFVLYIVITSPDFEQKALYQKEPTILYDIKGNEITRIGTKDSTIVTYDELPEVLIDSLIATEDSRFFQHNGIDLVRFLKASFLQLMGQSDAGGASTLSMQVVKNTYTQKGKLEESMVESLVRKFRDIYMSVFKLEANYTKEEIIEFYLNSQWFANTGNVNVSSGLWGVERASEWYFGKSVKDLNLAEASLMAGMFQNTSWYNPYKNPEGCRNRQKTVLTLMVKHGYITEEQKEAVLAIPISSMFISHETEKASDNYQAFIDYALNEVNEKYGIDPFETSLQIYTTFDPEIQKVLENVENGLAFEFPNEKVQEGIAVTDTENGALVALSGGRNYAPKGDNRANIQKQPGSTAKPLVDYSMYIEHISQSTYAMLLDEKTTYSNGTSISNYDNGYRGLVTMRYAIDDSRNIPALLAFQTVAKEDINIIKDFLKSVDIDYGSELYESASIGGFDKGVTPIELSAAYATFGRGGYYIEPYSFTKIINNETGHEENYSYTKKQVMEESTAYMITDILLDAYGGTYVGTQVAGKTGTTNLDDDTKTKYGLPRGALMDAWLTSYSPSHSISLWYGYDKIENDAKENKYYLDSNSGGTARRRIMNYLAANIYDKGQSFKKPSTVTSVDIESETFPAQLCSEFTPTNMCIKGEFFVRGTEPTEVSKRYSKLSNPTNGSYSFNGTTITLKWDAIDTPDAIDNNYLQEHFDEYYGNYSNKYYQNRLSYNDTYIGNIGYEIYLKNESGTETYLGYTTSPTYSYNSTGGNHTFIIKSAYSIFKNNKSDGLTINTQADIQSPIEDIIDPDDSTTTVKPDNNQNNNNNSNNNVDEDTGLN